MRVLFEPYNCRMFSYRVLAGILYPAYSSFKAVRRKSHRDYVSQKLYSNFKPVPYHAYILCSILKLHCHCHGSWKQHESLFNMFAADQMDDVLDRVCHIPVGWGAHRHLLGMVCCPLWLLTHTKWCVMWEHCTLGWNSIVLLLLQHFWQVQVRLFYTCHNIICYITKWFTYAISLYGRGT